MIPTFGCLPSWFYINFIIPGIIGVNILLSIISVFMSIGLRNAIWNEDERVPRAKDPLCLPS